MRTGKYSYRLKQIDYNGRYEYSNAINIEIGEILPAEFSLSQNYPNPFNPVTTINYTVAKEGWLTLKVFNALGEETAVLVNEVKLPGNYEVDFDAARFSSGIYFYQIQAGEFTEVRKMQLIK